MTTTQKPPATQTEKPVDRLKATLALPSVEQQFKNAMADAAPLFVASLIDLYGGDSNLQKCAPNLVIMEALKAATLRLPINKGLGFAYIVAYKNKDGVYIPTFQIGYRGLIQLAMRTGQYACINADVVYEGELKSTEKLTGYIDLSGEKTSDKIVGYFAHFELLNGFRKTVYITLEDVTKHAKKFSKSLGSNSSSWKTDFDAMATKTPLRKLLGKYGILSVEMQKAFTFDHSDDDGTPLLPGPNEGTLIDMDMSDTNGEGAGSESKGPDF
jgi:recombination protein RecT